MLQLGRGRSRGASPQPHNSLLPARRRARAGSRWSLSARPRGTARGGWAWKGTARHGSSGCDAPLRPGLPGHTPTRQENLGFPRATCRPCQDCPMSSKPVTRTRADTLQTFLAINRPPLHTAPAEPHSLLRSCPPIPQNHQPVPQNHIIAIKYSVGGHAGTKQGFLSLLCLPPSSRAPQSPGLGAGDL